jgi:hypothetical protein
MSENTALWDKLGRTDPAHTKKFKRAGGFEGTAIKPMWSYRRLTEEFGPCGIGWGVEKPEYTVVPGNNGEVLVYCTVSGWYLSDGEKKHVWGVGGDKVVTYIKANEQYKRPERWENDDEAFKKAFTDGLTNAFKFIGVGADVHMGMFDDNKYVNTLQREFAEERQDHAKEPPAKEEVAERPKSTPSPTSKADARPIYTALEKSMRENKNTSDLKAWWRDADCKAERAKLPIDWMQNLQDAFADYGFELSAREQKAKAEGFPGSEGISDREAQQHPLNA